MICVNLDIQWVNSWLVNAVYFMKQEGGSFAQVRISCVDIYDVMVFLSVAFCIIFIEMTSVSLHQNTRLIVKKLCF